MAENSKLTKLKLTAIATVLLAGAAQFGTNAFAEEGIVTEMEMLKEAVALYEKLSGSEVDVPESLTVHCGDVTLGKAVMLGFANVDEINSISEALSLRKQDAMTVLYKTIIDFDDSFALTSDEIDEYLNKCCDNALIDEENRVGYAFMIKHGIIYTDGETEPNKEITWKSCNILTDVLYNLFVQEVTIETNTVDIKIGTNIENVTDILGEPSRIDSSDYDFDWYVYNSDYNYFTMIGVVEDRICAVYTNSSNFAYGDLKSGDDYLLTYKYALDPSFRFFEDAEGKIDAIMYNPCAKNEDITQINPLTRTGELIDLINAYRTKHGYDALKLSVSMSESAQEMALQPKYIELSKDLRYAHTMDNAQHESGNDIFEIYSKLIASDSSVTAEDTNLIGIGSAITEDGLVMTSVMSTAATGEELDNALTDFSSESLSSVIIPNDGLANNSEYIENTLDETTVDSDTEDASVSEDATAETPSAEETIITDNAIVTQTVAEIVEADETIADTQMIPLEEDIEEESSEIDAVSDVLVNDGEDFVIDLTDNTASEYLVKIYSIEDDEYVVNSYIKTDDNKLVFDAALFTAGKDYSVLINTIADTDTENIEFMMSYGEASDDAVTVISPEMNSVSDNDFIELEWGSDIYHDFAIDIYNEDGQLLISQPVKDSKSVRINNVEPGNYYIYISALRRGDNSVIKAQANVNVRVELPKPIITEHILGMGEKFYPVYEDQEMGLLYFYDEDIVDVEVPLSNGRTTTVKRKKITQKQVKATAYYTQLANMQQKVEYFEGSHTLTIKKETEFIEHPTTNGRISVATTKFGAAIVEETKKYLGIPYLWGGITTNGFDCSGLVQYVYKNLGIDLPRVSQQQCLVGTPVSREELIPGDLVFFSKNGDVHHVGIYVGNGMMIHAPYTGTVIQYQSIDTGHYNEEFCGGRRVY